MKKENKYSRVMYGMCIGVGTGLGVAFDHAVLGMAIGLGVGMFIGSLSTNIYDDDMK